MRSILITVYLTDKNYDLPPLLMQPSDDPSCDFLHPLFTPSSREVQLESRFSTAIFCLSDAGALLLSRARH